MKIRLKNVVGHFKTITHHKILVMKNCFRVGLYRQGLLHDMSKYTPSEFIVGCRYFQGDRSPNAAERDDKGYSSAWLHHKGRNKHHYEYWIDVDKEDGYRMAGMKMPVKYVIEMFMDRIAASKTYKKEKYTDRTSLEYYNLTKDVIVIHPETRALLEKLLVMLADEGEDEVFDYIKREILNKKSK